MAVTLNEMLSRAGVKADLSPEVGQLQIAQAGGMGALGMNSIRVVGVVGDDVLTEKLCIDGDTVTYESGTAFGGGMPNTRVLRTLETIARVNKSKVLNVPTPTTPEACKALAAAGYAPQPRWNEQYWSKNI